MYNPRSSKNILPKKKILFRSLNAEGIQGFVKGSKKCNGKIICDLTDETASNQIEKFDAIVFDIIYYRPVHVQLIQILSHFLIIRASFWKYKISFVKQKSV